MKRRNPYTFGIAEWRRFGVHLNQGLHARLRPVCSYERERTKDTIFTHGYHDGLGGRKFLYKRPWQLLRRYRLLESYRIGYEAGARARRDIDRQFALTGG
jgi:hypothetical protein